MTQHDAISFELPEEQRKAIADNQEGGVQAREDVAIDVTAFSAYNCAWLPPETKDGNI